jgi:hypothetical protein
MKQKRESFDSFVQDSKSPGGSSTKSDKASPRSAVSAGRPPLSANHASERDELIKKMKESLQEKRQRISNIHKADNHKSNQSRIVSRSPQTVGTTTTEESASSSASWVADMGTSTDRDDVLGSKGTTKETRPSASSSKMKGGKNESNPKKRQKEHFQPIQSDGFETDQSSSRGTNEGSKSALHSTTTHSGSGDKKVSFHKNLEVIEEMAPPAVVHCMSFESTLSKEPSSSAYTPFGSTESPIKKSISPSPKHTSRDTSHLDEGLSRMLRYTALVNDRDRRISLMQQLEQTFTELRTLHEELEKEKQVPPRDEADSDLSDEIPDDDGDEDSSCDFTNDSNTSGWSSTGETNSKLDSLLQYMTSDDGTNSLSESFQSFGRFSFSLSKSASNLETLQENDEIDVHEHLESEGDEKAVLPLSPTSMASTITGSGLMDSVDNSVSVHAGRGDEMKPPSRTKQLKVKTSIDTSKPSKDAPGGTKSIASFYRLENDRYQSKSVACFPKTVNCDTPTSQDPTVCTSHKKDGSINKESSALEHILDSTTSERNDPVGDRVERGEKSIKIEDLLPRTIPRDPTEEFSLKGGTDNVSEKKSNKELARDPSSDDTPPKLHEEKNFTTSNEQLAKLPRDPSCDDTPLTVNCKLFEEKNCTASDKKLAKELPRDPSCDDTPLKLHDNKDTTIADKQSTKQQQLCRDPSCDDTTPGIYREKEEDREQIDPMINVIRENHAVSKGIVQRAINKWEAAKEPRKPDPPILEITINRDSVSVNDDDDDEEEAILHDAGATEINSSQKVESKEITESCQAQDETYGVPSVVEFRYEEVDPTHMDTHFFDKQEEDGALPTQPRKKSRKFLFVPRKLANERCMALGGLFDLAKKTGISTSSTICVKSRYIPRPPSMIAIHAEFQCGTRGSLYDLARRSGCPFSDLYDDDEEPQKVAVSTVVGGKKKWVLKTRGGHHHISVWTTLGNQVMGNVGNGN